jgi:hypothetical protein
MDKHYIYKGPRIVFDQFYDSKNSLKWFLMVSPKDIFALKKKIIKKNMSKHD